MPDLEEYGKPGTPEYHVWCEYHDRYHWPYKPIESECALTRIPDIKVINIVVQND